MPMASNRTGILDYTTATGAFIVAYHVGIAVGRVPECLAGADGDDPDVDA